MTCAKQRHVKAQEFSRLCAAGADTRSKYHAIHFGEGEFDLGSVAAATSWARLPYQGGGLTWQSKLEFAQSAVSPSISLVNKWVSPLIS